MMGTANQSEININNLLGRLTSVEDKEEVKNKEEDYKSLKEVKNAITYDFTCAIM